VWYGELFSKFEFKNDTAIFFENDTSKFHCYDLTDSTFQCQQINGSNWVAGKYSIIDGTLEFHGISGAPFTFTQSAVENQFDTLIIKTDSITIKVFSDKQFIFENKFSTKELLGMYSGKLSVNDWIQFKNDLRDCIVSQSFKREVFYQNRVRLLNGITITASNNSYYYSTNENLSNRTDFGNLCQPCQEMVDNYTRQLPKNKLLPVNSKTYQLDTTKRVLFSRPEAPYYYIGNVVSSQYSKKTKAYFHRFIFEEYGEKRKLLIWSEIELPKGKRIIISAVTKAMVQNINLKTLHTSPISSSDWDFVTHFQVYDDYDIYVDNPRKLRAHYYKKDRTTLKPMKRMDKFRFKRWSNSKTGSFIIESEKWKASIQQWL
jgi:hypothetical protein